MEEMTKNQPTIGREHAQEFFNPSYLPAIRVYPHTIERARVLDRLVKKKLTAEEARALIARILPSQEKGKGDHRGR